MMTELESCTYCECYQWYIKKKSPKDIKNGYEKTYKKMVTKKQNKINVKGTSFHWSVHLLIDIKNTVDIKN